MMSLVDELKDCLEAFSVRSPTSFTFFGRTFDVAPRRTRSRGRRLDDVATIRLGHVVYQRLHCRMPEKAPWSVVDPAASRDLMQQLSAANGGTGPWDAGWILRGAEAGTHFVVEKYRIRWLVPHGSFRGRSPNNLPGETGDVRVPKECRLLFPGYYMALGNAYDGRDEGTLRVYWHISADGAVPLVSQITGTLNQAQVPFRLKVMAEPSAFHRTDTAVLYLPRSLYEEATEHIATIHRAVRAYLADSVSAFAKRLARGTAVAEDPGLEESFGQHRSRLIATALNHEEVRRTGNRRRFEVLLHCLAEIGLNPEYPFLNGTVDRYQPFDA